MSRRNPAVGCLAVTDAHRRSYQEAIRSARIRGDFLTWFDNASNDAEAIEKGLRDFESHILTDMVAASLPSRRRAVEIGYGGGRLVNAACNTFSEVIGVDVHGEWDAASDFLAAQGHENFRLLTGDGANLPVDSASVDLVYSYIVLQHLPTFDAFRRYIVETARCLVPNGVAQLYFGSFAITGWRSSIRAVSAGYREIPHAPVNYVSLQVGRRRVERLCRANGLQVIESAGHGTQDSVTAVKRPG